MSKLSVTESKKIVTAIRAVFEASCTAWNRGDVAGYLASYWDSDKTIWISNGSLTRGRKAIEAAYKTRFSTPGQMGKLTLVDLEIEVLTSLDAIAFGRWMLTVEGGDSKGFFTVQLKKIEDAWVFVSDHSSTGV